MVYRFYPLSITRSKKPGVSPPPQTSNSGTPRTQQMIYENVEADPSDAKMNDDGAAPPVGQRKDDNDDAGGSATPGTERTSDPKALPPPQSGMSGVQIDLTDTKAVNEALHTHTHHITRSKKHITLRM